jgi:hypothetical protein
MKRLALVAIGIAFMFSPALAQESKPSSLSFFDVVGESLFGDVYATPSQWQPLTTRGLFSEGWNRPWASPPPGEGGAPRQGWLNAFDGVFYRLGLLTCSFADNFHDNGNQYAGGLTLYAPFTRGSRSVLTFPSSSPTAWVRATTTTATSATSRSPLASSFQKARTSRSRST